jgi:hypothetical protein
MAAGQDRRRARLTRACVAVAAVAAAATGAVAAAASWCLGFGALGPVRTGMTVEQVVRLADFAGMERRQPAIDCWYLHYRARGSDFDLMIIRDRVVRIELRDASKLRTVSGARIGSTEAQLLELYRGIETQPHKYDPDGHTLTYRSPDGEFGLRFDTSHGRVTPIQSGPWEHLHYVEGSS